MNLRILGDPIRGKSVLRIGGLCLAAFVALYIGAVRPHEKALTVARQSGTGLAEQAEIAADSDVRLFQYRAPATGIVGGVPGEVDKGKQVALHAAAYALAPEATKGSQASEASEGRRMVRTLSLEMLVRKPAETAEQIRALAEQIGGFLVSSEMRGDREVSAGSLTVRVPASRFEAARAEIRGLALRVENERVEAQDVTRQYVDQAANLRNLRAEEAQYLLILKQAKTVKDTLEVSEKISDVRGEIESQQAEFDALSKQIETVAMTITLRAETEARVWGLNWRPLYSLKLAVRDGLDGLAEYAGTMAEILFFLPTVLLWMVTIIASGAAAWRIARWIGRRWFGWSIGPTSVGGQSPQGQGLAGA